MTFKDLIKSANDILGLPINWDNTASDDNYKQLWACARLVVNELFGLWNLSDNTPLQPERYHLDQATVVYGVLTEYAFVAGMFNEWQIWREKYRTGLLPTKNGQVIPIP